MLIIRLQNGRRVTANGPAIWGGCVTRRSIRQLSWYPAPAGPRNCPGARRVWRTFCNHGTNFISFWRDSGTSYIGTANLSPVTKFVGCTGAVSRYKRKLKPMIESRYTGLIVSSCGYPGLTLITNLNCQPVVVKIKDQKKKEGSGCLKHLQFLPGWRLRHQAKSVTNNLPILSVLGIVIF